MRLRFGLGLTMALVLGVALVGCGGGSSTGPSTTPPPPAVKLKSIAVSGPTTAISGQTGLQYKATGTYSDGSTKDLTSSATWSSSVQSVVTVNSSGSATAVAGGVAQGGTHQTVTIIATSGSIKGSAALTVSDDLASIAVTPLTPTILESTQEAFTATGTFQDGSTQQINSSVTWSSSPSSFATINSSGVATGVAKGTATISAKCPCGTLVTAANLIPGATSLTVTAAGAGGLVSITVTAASQTLVVGATQDQLTATGTYASGPTQNITNSVTWAVSSKTNGADGSVSTTGGALGTTGGPAQNGKLTVQATLGTISGSIILPVVPALNAMTITTPGPGMVVAGTQQFKVKGLYNDNTNNDVTSLATWTSSPSLVTFNSSGLATAGNNPGVATVTSTIKNVLGANISTSTGVNVVASAYKSCLISTSSCPLTFTLSGVNSSGPVFYAGSFVADGKGNITGGEVDENAAGVVSAKVALIGGGYTVYPDGRGLLTFNQNAMFNTPGGITLRFILSSSGTLGKLMEFDNLGTLKGTMWQQTGSITDQLNGNYVFRLSGVDSSNNPMGEVGWFNTTGGGSINATGATVDVDDFSVDSSQVSMCSSGETCTVTAADTTGRGTLTMVQNLVEGSITTNYAYYVVTAASGGAPTLMNLIETDNNGAGGAAVAGTMAQQAGGGGTYVASTLNNSAGGYAFLLDRPVASGSCLNQCNVTEFAQVGEYTYTSQTADTGILTGIRDDTNPPPGDPFNVTGGYGLGGGSVIGRGTITTLGADSNRGYVFYMVSPSTTTCVSCGRAYVLQNETAYNPQIEYSFNAPVGEMDAQAGPFGANTLSGEYGLDASDISSPGLTTNLIWLSFGATGVSGIVDSSVGSAGTSATTIGSSIITSVTYTPPNATGRALLSVTTHGGQTSSFVLYLTSAQNAWVMSVAPTTVVGPDVDGSLNLQ